MVSIIAASWRHRLTLQLRSLQLSLGESHEDLIRSIWSRIHPTPPSTVSLTSTSSISGTLTNISCADGHSFVGIDLRSFAVSHHEVVSLNPHTLAMETIVRVGRDVSHVCVHDDVVYYADGKIKQLRRWSIRDSAELSSLNLPGSLAMLCSLPSGVFVVLSNTNRVYRLQPPSYSWLYQLEFDGPLLSFDTTTMDEDYFLYIPDHLIGDRPVGEVCLTTVSSDVLITTIAGATAARFVPNTDAFASVCCLFADELSCTVCLVDLIRQTTLSYSTPFMGWDVWSMAITDEWQVLVVVEESEDGVGGPNFSPGPFNAVTLRCNP